MLAGVEADCKTAGMQANKLIMPPFCECRPCKTCVLNTLSSFSCLLQAQWAVLPNPPNPPCLRTCTRCTHTHTHTHITHTHTHIHTHRLYHSIKHAILLFFLCSVKLFLFSSSSSSPGLTRYRPSTGARVGGGAEACSKFEELASGAQIVAFAQPSSGRLYSGWLMDHNHNIVINNYLVENKYAIKMPN